MQIGCRAAVSRREPTGELDTYRKLPNDKRTEERAGKAEADTELTDRRRSYTELEKRRLLYRSAIGLRVSALKNRILYFVA